MFRQKRWTAWTLPVMVQAALLSAGPLFAAEQDGSEKEVVVSLTDDVKEVVVATKNADDGQGNSEVPSRRPVLKSRAVKARLTSSEPSDGRQMEVIPKKEGSTTAIVGGRMIVKSADGKTFEIVAPEGALHVLDGKPAPGKPAGLGRALTILRTANGDHVLQVDEADALIDELTLNIKDKIAAEAPRFIIGVSVSEAPGVLMVQLGRDEDSAVVIDAVVDDSPAAKAGLKQFDVILKAAGEPVRSASDLTNAVKSSEGNEIEFLLLRAGKEMTIAITPRPNEPVRRTKVSDGVIHIGPAVMERRLMNRGEGMFGPGPLEEEIKALRRDMAELKKAVEELKASK